MKGETKLTICIANVMRENLLGRCLDAVRRHVSIPYRVIIINSGQRPLSFEDEIKVLNDPGLVGLPAKRKKFLELVETKYLSFLDNDILVKPQSIEYQVEALDKNPQMGAVSGLRFSMENFQGGIADFKFEDNKIIKSFYSLDEILSFEGNLFASDFIPMGHTTYRVEAFEDIDMDTEYIMGYAHWDTFLQFYHTDWKFSVDKRSRFEHIKQIPEGYYELRYGPIEESKKHFIEKWSLIPV